MLFGDIFFIVTPNTIPIRQQLVGTIHIPVNDYLVPLVTCTLTVAIVCLDTMPIYYCLLNTSIVIIIIYIAMLHNFRLSRVSKVKLSEQLGQQIGGN